MVIRLLVAPALLGTMAAAQGPAGTAVDLTASGRLTAVNVTTEVVTFKGKRAVKVAEREPGTDRPPGTLAIIADSRFRNGRIELEMAGEPSPGAPESGRGFFGLAFRVAEGAATYEYLYLRATNGRADDQVRRNHTVQYASHPDFPWPRLRKEFPEKYETYVDLQPAVWTKVRIEVDGTRARLFVHGAEQPTLVVNDLKLPESDGALALHVGPHTIAHFADLRVAPR